MIKVDGLPADTVDLLVRQRDPRTGKSQLPWIEHIFYQRGTRIANFYVRGMSLSAPSWSLLDTGQHLTIKGNVEFDRYTLHSYDYLNFIPFYLNSALQKRVDMPGPEVLDEVGVPLLFDAFPNDERYQSFQLLQRGVRWTTLQRGLTNRLAGLSPRDILDEWTTGFETRDMVTAELEREVIQKLKNPKIRYLDFFTSEFDHIAHHNRDIATQTAVIKQIDGAVGRIWTAIQNSDEANETALILVSDHGFNSDNGTYSQGFNLVKLLGSEQGGGHHVITKRRLLLDYSIKGIYPLVPLVTTTTPDSYYLKGQSTNYPTALLDFDGNERASIHLRDSDLNLLHILFQELQRSDLSPQIRSAVRKTFFDTIDRRRTQWALSLKELNEEIAALRRAIERQRGLVETLPKKWTAEDALAGRDREALRAKARLGNWVGEEKEYSDYAKTLANLLSLSAEGFQPSKVRISDFVARGAMGDHNSINQLQNYIVGIAPDGLKAGSDGGLDLEHSFRRVNYFQLLRSVQIRNNVQPGVSNQPIDFVAKRIPAEAIAAALSGDSSQFGDAVWVYDGEERQALILSKRNSEGTLSLRYIPIRGLTETRNGEIRWDSAQWRPGLPLRIWEDPNLNVPEAAKSTWLNEWHTDIEWLHALHKTAYSNGFIGLNEQLGRHPSESLTLTENGLSEDQRMLRRFRLRQRQLVEADLLVLANNHWNFDVRGFNPGGNHGSFFRISTHSTLMFAGGANTRIPQGLIVDEPYDSLSLAPTVLALMGEVKQDNVPVSFLTDRGFRQFPGRVINQVFGGKNGERRDGTVAKGDLNPN